MSIVMKLMDGRKITFWNVQQIKSNDNNLEIIIIDGVDRIIPKNEIDSMKVRP